MTGAVNQEQQQLRAQLELLKHGADSSSTVPADTKPDPSASPSSRPVNGYDEIATASRDAARAIGVKSEAEAHIHPDLRGPAAHGAPTANMMPMASVPAGHSPASSSEPSPATAIAPAPPAPATAPEQVIVPDGRKTKRELSQSKRAAQNRAAQRAFRQRKEGYIKKLEQQVREYTDMEQTFKAMHSENFVLREYVINLQSRLLDIQGEFPPAPPNINLSHPTAPQPPTSSGPDQTSSGPGVGTPLEAVAQAVAGLAAQEKMTESQQAYRNRGEEDTRTAEEINSQLQSEDGSARSS